MGLEEYYLTRAEYEIISTNTSKLIDFMPSDNFNLIEFGAGDGQKVTVLLEALLNKNIDFNYVPVDISSNALQQLSENLRNDFPELKINGICRDYFHAFNDLHTSNKRNVALFLGSNIGNLFTQEALHFLKQMRATLNQDDLFLIGFDLKKNPQTVLNAYNDPWGITRAFNLNLLERMNNELGADFNLDNFSHYPTYDPLTGLAESYLVSTKTQSVEISALETVYNFEAWEPMHTELSQKYDMATIQSFAEAAGFCIQSNFYDCKQHFVDSLWQAV